MRKSRMDRRTIFVDFDLADRNPHSSLSNKLQKLIGVNDSHFDEQFIYYTLNEEEASIFDLRVDGFTIMEIAEKMGMTYNMTWRRLHDIQEKIKKYF